MLCGSLSQCVCVFVLSNRYDCRYTGKYLYSCVVYDTIIHTTFSVSLLIINSVKEGKFYEVLF